MKISSAGLPPNAKKVESSNFESDSSVPQNTNSLDLHTEGAVSVEPSGSLMLGQGPIPDETNNQVTVEWENVDGVDCHTEYGKEVDEEDGDLAEEMKLTEKFIMKNGCCRECMKAFSKTGKVSKILLYKQISIELSLPSAQTPKKSNTSSQWL